MILTLDIETIPTHNPEALARLTAKVQPPVNYKKAETIAAWEETEKPVLVEERRLKTSLDGAYGSIFCIGWAVDDMEPAISQTAPLKSERDMLILFYDTLDSFVERNRGRAFDKYVGHNLSNFDLRFIWQRSVVNGVPVPYWWPHNLKPWDEKVADTMTMWCGTKGTISQDDLCFALGIDGKGDLDGSKVHEYVAAGRYAEVWQYCVGDVVRTRALYKRMTGAI